MAGETVEMPDVIDVSLENARNQLESMGLKVKVENIYSDTVDENDIVKTSPKKGEDVKLGATVTLYVSKGKETKKVEMPDLVGKKVDEAKYVLTKAKLEVGAVEKQHSDIYKKDEVIWQSEEKGAELKEGPKINLVISLGPEETEKETETEEQTQAPQTGYATVKMPVDAPSAEGTIVIEVIYANGSVNTVYSGSYSAASGYDSSWSTSVTGELGSSANVIAYINGIQYSTYTIYFS